MGYPPLRHWLLVVFLGVVSTLQAEPHTPTFTDLDGESVTLEHHHGQLRVVNFWASWCPPCVKEMPAFERLQQQLGDENLQVIAINVGESALQVRDFLETFEIQLSFPVWMDPDWQGFRTFELQGLPTTLVMSPSGEVLEVVVGERHWDQPEMTDPLRRLLSSQPR